MAPTVAILLIAHGSRHCEANDDSRYLAEELAKRVPHSIAVAAFLELAEPDIDTGAAQCVESGARRIVLLPHFLAAGIHVQRDLCAARDRLAIRYPLVEFFLAEPVGRHPLMVEILWDRATCRNWSE